MCYLQENNKELLTLRSIKERIRKDSRKVKTKLCGRNERNFTSGGRRIIMLIETPRLCSLVLVKRVDGEDVRVIRK
jgi:hypothetical protein